MPFVNFGELDSTQARTQHSAANKRLAGLSVSRDTGVKLTGDGADSGGWVS